MPQFITLTHPSQQSDREIRRRVFSHIGRYHRNRSRPSSISKSSDIPAFTTSTTKQIPSPEQFIRTLTLQRRPRDALDNSAASSADQTLQLARKNQKSIDDGKKAITTFDPGVLVLTAKPTGSSTGLQRPFYTTESIVLQYYMKHPTTASFRQETLIARDTSARLPRFAAATQDILLRALSSEVHLQCVLSETAHRMTNIFPDNPELPKLALKSTQQAIVHLRQRISEPSDGKTTDPAVIIGILHLCVGAWNSRDFDAATTHLRALQLLISNYDRDSNLYTYVIECVRFYDINIALETGDRPVIPCDWDPPDIAGFKDDQQIDNELSNVLHKSRKQPLWNPSIHLTPEDALGENKRHSAFITTKPTYEEGLYLSRQVGCAEQKPGRGFLEAIKLGLLGSATCEILRRSVRQSDIGAIIFLSDRLDEEKVQWFNKKGLATLHLLLSLETKYSIAHALLDECVRLSMIMILTYGHASLPWRTVRQNLYRLKPAVQSLHKSCFQAIQGGTVSRNHPQSRIRAELLLWIYVTGMLASYGLNEERQWFEDLAVKVAKALGLRTYIDLHHTMGRYAHQDTLHHSCLHDLAVRLNSNS